MRARAAVQTSSAIYVFVNGADHRREARNLLRAFYTAMRKARITRARFLTRIIHERFCCDRRSAATTSLRPSGSPLEPSMYCTGTHRVLTAPRAGLGPPPIPPPYLDDVTIHDLRRTCASWLAISGENIAVISKVLNHTTLANTVIYARLNQAPVKAALTKHADTLLGSGVPSVAEIDPSVLHVTPRVPTTPQPPQPPEWAPSRTEEREEWPG